LQFVLAELGTTGDLGENNKLTLKGRYSPKQLEVLLKKYISMHLPEGFSYFVSGIRNVQDLPQP
jgi:hypothetical protein